MTAVLRAALLALPFAFLFASSGLSDMGAQDNCLSWSEARAAGLTDKFKLRPATEIKSDVERRYDGKVVSFEICPAGADLIYRLAVFKSDGKVLFVTEPAASAAEPAAPAPEDGR